MIADYYYNSELEQLRRENQRLREEEEAQRLRVENQRLREKLGKSQRGSQLDFLTKIGGTTCSTD